MLTKIGKEIAENNRLSPAIPTGAGAAIGGMMGFANNYMENASRKENYDFWSKAHNILGDSKIKPEVPKKAKWGVPVGLALGALGGYGLHKAIEHDANKG